MKNLCNLLIVAELQIIIKAVFAKLFRMLALLLTLCANKVVCSTQTQRIAMHCAQIDEFQFRNYSMTHRILNTLWFLTFMGFKPQTSSW